VLSLETGEYHVVLEGGTNARYSPTGHLIYARAGSLLAAPFDLEELRVKGAPVPVLEEVATSPIYGQAEFGISGNGSLVYAPGDSWGDDHRVLWVDREGRWEPLIEDPRAFLTLQLSPDGHFLVVSIDGAQGSMWMYDLARSTLTRLTLDSDFHPIWTPRGDRVTFMSDRAGSWNLYWQPADGSGQAERLTTSEYTQFPGSWSPDGKLLVFQEERTETGSDIWILSMEGERTARPLLQEKFNERRPMFSPNGRWILYVSDESGRDEVYVQPFPGPGAKRQVSSGGGTNPLWNPNGREIFYRNGDQMMAVEVKGDATLVLDTPRMLFQRDMSIGRLARLFSFSPYDVTPDGQRFVMIDDSESARPPTQLILVQNWAEELKQLVPTENEN
jgi:dipeptidyl aminopeptidase/acylaminoacyl peptidase